MIIKCEGCSRKFLVKDRDIPKKGRMVQCSYCSQKWFQIPIKIQSSVKLDVDKNIYKIEMEASDGKTYKFMGKQWAELLPSGKTGIMAKKEITRELNRLTRSKQKVSPKIDDEIDKVQKEIDPSAEKIISEKTKEGLGFFGYIFLLIILALSIIGILKTFENELLSYFPELKYILKLLDKQTNYIFESSENIMIIIRDLINSY